jgi:hypothetical protein
VARNSQAPAENTDAIHEETAAASAEPQAGNVAEGTDAPSAGGLQGAEDLLAKEDEDVTMLWSTGGPRNSKIEKIAGFFFKGSVVLVTAYKSGKFKVYSEA